MKTLSFLNKFVFQAKKIILLSMLMTVFLLCNAQENVRFYVFSYPPHAHIEFDGKQIFSSDTGSLSTAGQHKLKVFLPEYNVVDTLVELKKDKPNVFRIYLKFSPQYLDYQKNLSKNKFKNFGRYIPPVTTFIATGFLFAVLNNKAVAYHKAAEQDEVFYANTHDQSIMDAAKTGFETNRKNYKKYKNYSLITAGCMIIPAVWTIRVAIKNKQRSIPKFEQNN